MNNVVQNISIDNIIPGNFNPSNEEIRKIEELAQLIKTFGLIDPILVRPKNGKYEIVLGIDKYQAALMANQTMIPAIIKEVDDEIFSKYSNIDNNQTISSKSLQKETFSRKEKNSDIVNLSELSKINLEYERDDLKMNNGQFNNEMMNNNFGQPNMGPQNQMPTFGGKFFPSLEDEPTNMNMMPGMNSQPIETAPPVNNNFIDLTDLSSDKEPTPMATPNFGMPSMNAAPMDVTPNFNQDPQVNISMPNQDMPPMGMPTNDNIINLDVLQNNNAMVNPVSEPVSMDILNADFGAPISQPMNTQMPNQFGMEVTNNFNPMPNLEVSNNFSQIPNLGATPYNNPIQPEFDLGQQPMPMPEPQFNNPIPDFNMNQTPEIKPEVSLAEQIISAPEAVINTSKDVTPVTNTIKNLVNSLEAFGYKININEENLTNITKITIEIEK